ncbi:MAG: RluA family pseudouridine synthase [Coraliomargaritaceae bacterium]
MADRQIEFRVPQGTSGSRADKLFSAAFEDVSRARLQRAFDAGCVTCDGAVIDRRFKVTGGELLRAVLEEPEAGIGPRAVSIPLEIVYEDASLVVVNKAAGMVTHPGSGTDENTLVHALLHHTNNGLSAVGAPERPGIVHRLDKETTGLIVVAKTDLAHHRLAAAFSERETEKRYLALVLGVPECSSGSIRQSIGRHPTHRTRMAVQPNGKEAHTDWKVLKRFGSQAAQVECRIHTGRTHQIRVHMSYLKQPLLGDTTYGFRANRLQGIEVPRVMLHAAELAFPHPDTGESVRFTASLPEDFETVRRELSQQM